MRRKYIGSQNQSEKGHKFANTVKKYIRTKMTDLSMIRWMCNKSLRDGKASAELRERLGLLSIREVISRNRLRWFGHVERMKLSSWARRIVEVEVPGSRSRGRPRKTWWETVSVDMRKRGLNRELAQD